MEEIKKSAAVSNRDQEVDQLKDKISQNDRGRRGMSARLRLNAPWLENCVRQDCDISHSE